MTAKEASCKHADSKTRSHHCGRRGSAMHVAEREHPADCQCATRTSEPVFVGMVVLRAMSFVMTPPVKTLRQ